MGPCSWGDTLKEPDSPLLKASNDSLRLQRQGRGTQPSSSSPFSKSSLCCLLHVAWVPVPETIDSFLKCPVPPTYLLFLLLEGYCHHPNLPLLASVSLSCPCTPPHSPPYWRNLELFLLSNNGLQPSFLRAGSESSCPRLCPEQDLACRPGARQGKGKAMLVSWSLFESGLLGP